MSLKNEVRMAAHALIPLSKKKIKILHFFSYLIILNNSLLSLSAVCIYLRPVQTDSRTHDWDNPTLSWSANKPLVLRRPTRSPHATALQWCDDNLTPAVISAPSNVLAGYSNPSNYLDPVNSITATKAGTIRQWSPNSRRFVSRSAKWYAIGHADLISIRVKSGQGMNWHICFGQGRIWRVTWSEFYGANRKMLMSQFRYQFSDTDGNIINVWSVLNVECLDCLMECLVYLMIIIFRLLDTGIFWGNIPTLFVG